MSSRFCTNCGDPLDAGNRFCGKCGHPARDSEETPPEAPSEPVLGIIPNLQRHKGLMSYEAFNLVVTPRRLVFAAMTAEMLRQAAKEAAEASKSGGKGLLGQAWATMTSGMTYYQRLQGMTPDQIMGAHQLNWQLELSRICSIRIRDGNDQNGNEPDEILINVSGGRHVFRQKGLDTRSARQLLRRVVPDVR